MKKGFLFVSLLVFGFGLSINAEASCRVKTRTYCCNGRTITATYYRDACGCKRVSYSGYGYSYGSGGSYSAPVAPAAAAPAVSRYSNNDATDLLQSAPRRSRGNADADVELFPFFGN